MSSKRSAVAVAVWCAQGVVVTRPSTKIATPRAAMIHQLTWVAAVNPGPIAPAAPLPARAPRTATPSVCPTWRPVDATAAATPAWAGGIPDTAVLVIGG